MASINSIIALRFGLPKFNMLAAPLGESRHTYIHTYIYVYYVVVKTKHNTTANRLHAVGKTVNTCQRGVTFRPKAARTT